MIVLRTLVAPLLLALAAVGPVTAEDVTQEELQAFVQQVKSCWALTPEDVASGLSVKVRLNLDVQGNVSDIELLTPYKSVTGQRIATGAVRALQRCAPYSFSAESYESWKTLEIDLQP